MSETKSEAVESRVQATEHPHRAAELIVAEVHYAERLTKAGVPERLHGGLVRYLVHGMQPGHFLTAVLENDLAEAMGRADESSRASLFALVSFLYNDAPSTAWGSPSKVASWRLAKAEGR
jgi:hypothetical protein